METVQTYYNEKRERVNLWFEDVNGTFDFWEKTNGISQSITKRQYLNRIKKNNLSDILGLYLNY
jgi:hypothetical protein